MDPIALLALINASLSLVEKSLPIVQQLKNNGEITPAQQAELLAQYESLKTQADGQFQGPEWQITV